MSRALLLLLLALLTACSSSDQAARWVEAVERGTAEADEALASGDVAAAQAALEGVVRLEAPRSVAPDDARVVAQDAAWRLTLLTLDTPSEALRWADMGLSRGGAGDLFHANLLSARGAALEALGRDVEAARDYHAALLINDALVDQALARAKEAP